MIEAVGLTKVYGKHKAVRNVSFHVQAGEIVGFLGPNGAGKSTTMNMLTGYISATSGAAKIGPWDILENPEKAKRMIGYLPESPPVYGDMRVDEYLRFVADIKKVKPSARTAMLNEIKDTVRIADVSKRLIRNLSKGYRQRVGLAQALVGYPEALILDEPTSGLDPKQIVEMRDLIKRLGKKHTIILSSHILPEVSAVCDRVIIIHNGEIVASDTPERLSQSMANGKTMAVRLKGDIEQARQAFHNVSAIGAVKNAGIHEPGTVDLEISRADEAADAGDIREIIFSCAARAGTPILMMKSLDLSLEDIFMQLTGKNTGSAGDDADETAPEPEENTIEEGGADDDGDH